jgi:hypothetical protein
LITLRPYDDATARQVLGRLDLCDQLEAEFVRGRRIEDPLSLWADWRAMVPAHLLSLVALDRRRDGQGFIDVPFAVVALANTGQAGVAQAALLARDHAAFGVALARLAVMIRRGLPDFAAQHGIHRIEARSWGDHPTAGRLLRQIGFAREAVMPGFGVSGSVAFHQWAWISRAVPVVAEPPPVFTRRRPASSPTPAEQEPAPCA